MTVKQLTQPLTHVLIQHTSISLDLEKFENLNHLVMVESVYSGDVTKFWQCVGNTELDNMLGDPLARLYVAKMPPPNSSVYSQHGQSRDHQIRLG